MILRSAGMIAVAGVVAAACRPAPGIDSGSTLGHVHITFTGGGDTAGFQVPVRLRRCGDDRGVVLDGALHGNGFLVWLRDGTGLPDGGNYTLLSRGDSSATRGAIASVRYIVGTVAHGLMVDSGTAVLSGESAPYTVHVAGSGAEVSIQGRRGVELTADDVPLARDTVNCQVQL